VTDAVGRALGMSTELVEETTYEAYREDRNDVCFVCSLPYVVFESDGISPVVPIAAPAPSGSRYRSEPVYFSDVIVRRDSPFQSFLDLRGRSWAYNESLSQSGYGITRYHLVTLGETEGFFGSVVESGFHEESIRMVQRGEVDASAIDSHLLGVELRDKPGLRRSLRIVDTFGPSTIQPVVVSKRIGRDLRKEIRNVLLRLHIDPATRPLLDFGAIRGFTAAGPESYDDIRRMLAVCEAAGFMRLR
jgi:phosphonate transport system substrate-binding protein